jgi:AICAR transformylase/IMP cyclohydrolase PurH
MASDVPISLHDVNVAAQGRIALIIVPSASKEIIAAADKYNLSLITTGFTNILY